MAADVIGTSIGPYRIVGLLGAGGMGEVYRGHDARLKRDVAIKVIPDILSRQPERLQRLKREAQILAALDHVHIARIFGIEELGGACALVLELVEGPTLADRIAAGPLRIPEAMAIARQIADALETAHEQGIIHRDLKPGNVKLRSDGVVKVLDFGLARMDDPTSAGIDAPTVTAAATREGTVMGTPAYMSPEQAQGRAVDRRTDIWAFGCVLFEMLTGRRAYAADSTAATLGRILEREPDWEALPNETPPVIRGLLMRCLRKDPRHRLRDIGDARLTIEEYVAAPADGPDVTAARRSRVSSLLVLSAVALAAIAVTYGLTKSAAADPPARDAPLFDRVVRFVASPAHEFSPVISPDGKWVAYLSNAGARTDIWLKFIAERGDAVNLTRSLDLRVQGTDTIGGIDVSPDGSEISFIGAGSETLAARNSVYAIPAPLGGPPRLLVEQRQGLRWSPDGKRLTYIQPGGLRGDRLLIADADGQNEKEIVRADGARHIHQPRWSADTKYVYFNYGYQNGNSEPTEIFRVGVEGGVPERVVATARRATAPLPGPDGRMLFFAANPDTADASLWARDLGTGRDERITFGVGEYGAPSISADGRRLVAAVSELRQSIVRVATRSAVAPSLEPLTDGYTGDLDPSWSPDGTRLAFSSSRTGNRNIWWADGGDLSKAKALTTGPAIDEGPVYSPDATRIAFVSDRQGRRGIWVVGANGGTPRLVVAVPVLLSVISWSPDGRRLAYATPGTEVPQLEIVEVSTGKITRLATEKSASSPAWSPVEDVIAYIESTPSDGSRVRFITGDGRAVTRGRPDDTVLLNNGFLRWSRDGRRLAGVGVPGNQPGYVYLIDPFGQEPPRKLIDLAADVYPRGAAWASDGSSILLGLSKTTGDIILAERSR